jgi:hypothetical protein
MFTCQNTRRKLHKVEGCGGQSAQIVLVVHTFYKVLNAYFVNSDNRNLCLGWSDQGTLSHKHRTTCNTFYLLKTVHFRLRSSGDTRLIFA